MLTTLGALALIFIPGAIPVYCTLTFMMGFVDAQVDEIHSTQNCTSRYQVYSCYRLGVKFYNWMIQRVK